MGGIVQSPCRCSPTYLREFTLAQQYSKCIWVWYAWTG